MNLYDIKVKNIKGEEISLDRYKNKTLLVVNVASKCGFTKQYEGLEELYKKYKDKDFCILAFPCNQFGAQESGSDEEIEQFCTLNFNVSFDMFGKIEVNGQNEHQLYKYLKNEAKGIFGSKNIKWNFTKFLIDKQGIVLKRYSPSTPPQDLEKDIQKVL